jgi:hypothetical protein
MNSEPHTTRYFVSYSGIKLPLKMVNELTEGETRNRNSYFRVEYDDQRRISLCQKLVYGEVEMEHRYHYDDNDVLRKARIMMTGEVQDLTFDASGNVS